MNKKSIIEIINDCMEETNNRIVPCKGKRAEFRIINNKNKIIKRVKIDECMIKNKIEGKFCDYFVIILDELKIFVKLKGNKVIYALNQVLNTLEFMKKNSIIRDEYKEIYIVSSNVNISNTKKQKKIMEIRKKHPNSKVIIKSRNCERII